MYTLKILTSLCLTKYHKKDHKKDCLVIHGKQNVILERGFICFKNFSRQINVPFKIYDDFECI